MSDRMWDDQDKIRENGMEEIFGDNNEGRAKSALQDLCAYVNSTTNHLKAYEKEIEKRLAAVSLELEQLTTTANVELEKKNTDLRRRLTESESERKRYRNERNALMEKFNVHELKKFTTEQEIKFRREIEDLRQAYDKIEKEWAKRLKESEETSDTVIKEQKRKIEQITEDVKAREMKIKSLEETLQSTRLGFKDWNEMKTQLEDNKRQLNETNDKLQRALSKLNFTEKELDETKSRLSKAVGEKLTDNNPNIADLSDKNRPTKLAEKYAELYDNQWTDAYEEIETYFGTEEDTIRVLLEILMDVMTFCEQKAKGQMEKLQSDLTCSGDSTKQRVPDNIMKQLKELRKMLATVAKDRLYQDYLSILKISREENRRHAIKVEPFVKECFEVCWFMAIQDPPIVLCASGKSGESLNTNLYKAYTSSGRYIKFLVWPAMLLHKSGPVLAKGIAQGTNEIKVLKAWVGDKVIPDYFPDRDICDFRSLSRTPREEGHTNGQSQDVSHIRNNRYLSSGEDRHHQRSKSAEATRPSYKQSTVATTGLGTKSTVHVRRHKDERHPTSEEMRRYFYYIDRRDYSGAQNALGYDVYRQCLHNEHKRSQYR